MAITSKPFVTHPIVHRVSDEISQAMLYPVAHRLIGKCDAIYRIEGESKGADMDIEVARKLGLPVYHHVDSIPQA